MLTSRQRSPISGLTLTLLAPDSQPHLLQRPVAPPSPKRSQWHPGVLGWMGGGQTGTRLRGAPWCLFLPQSPLPWRDHQGGLVLTGAPHEVMVPLPPHCMATCGGLTARPHVWGSAICQHDIPAAEGCLPCRVAGGQAGPRGGAVSPEAMLAGRLPPRSASGSAWEGVRQSLSPGAEAALPGGRRGRSPLPILPPGEG